MIGIEFYRTDDKSVGLYDNNAGDIYHSKSGALKEAFEKFINPSLLNKKSKNKDEMNILDICSGVGYNLKAALLSTDKKCKTTIDCLDTNIVLIKLSPFIQDGIDDIDLKIYLLSEVIKEVNYDYSFLSEILNNYAPFLCDDMRRFIEFLLTRGYLTKGRVLNRSFLHNI